MTFLLLVGDGILRRLGARALSLAKTRSRSRRPHECSNRRRRRPGYKCHPRGQCKTRPMIDLLRFVPDWPRISFAVASNWSPRTRFFDSSASSPSGSLPGASGGRPGSASRLFSPRESRQLGVKQPCSSSARPFYVGIAQDSARSGGVALGGRDDRQRRVPRSSARWRDATHAGVPSASVASCSS